MIDNDQEDDRALAPVEDGSPPADDGGDVSDAKIAEAFTEALITHDLGTWEVAWDDMTPDEQMAMTDAVHAVRLMLAPKPAAAAAAAIQLRTTLRRAKDAINGVACLRLPLEGRKHPVDDDERRQLVDACTTIDEAITTPPGDVVEQLAELLTALVDITCHAVANLHPETTRDVPAEALEKAAAWIGTFFPASPRRADELAHVWSERAQLVEHWRDRRGREGAEPEPPQTPFPTAVAAGYLQSRQGNPGVFGGQHEIGTNREGQPVIMQRTGQAAPAKAPRKAPPKAKAAAAKKAKPKAKASARRGGGGYRGR